MRVVKLGPYLMEDSESVDVWMVRCNSRGLCLFVCCRNDQNALRYLVFIHSDQPRR